MQTFLLSERLRKLTFKTCGSNAFLINTLERSSKAMIVVVWNVELHKKTSLFYLLKAGSNLFLISEMNDAFVCIWCCSHDYCSFRLNEIKFKTFKKQLWSKSFLWWEIWHVEDAYGKKGPQMTRLEHGPRSLTYMQVKEFFF